MRIYTQGHFVDINGSSITCEGETLDGRVLGAITEDELAVFTTFARVLPAEKYDFKKPKPGYYLVYQIDLPDGESETVITPPITKIRKQMD